MKSDTVKITNAGAGMDEALKAASAAAVYRGLEKKNAIRLRLLAEETMGMVREITGETEGDFWVESEGEQFELHLIVHPLVTGKMRKELLDASSSGKNESAKGFMGKIRDIIDRALSAEDVGYQADYYTMGISSNDLEMTDPMMYAATASMVSWSMRNYRNAIEESPADDENREKWDELEKSIVANIADEVKIAIRGNEVEMIVYKNFE